MLSGEFRVVCLFLFGYVGELFVLSALPSIGKLAVATDPADAAAAVASSAHNDGC